MFRSALLSLLVAASTIHGADFNIETTTSYTLPVHGTGEVHNTFAALMDQPLNDHWHFVWGAEYDRFDVTKNTPFLPDALQSIGAHLGLEYREGDDPVFLLQLQPGWHSDQDLSDGTFDSPVTLATGYHVANNVDLAFGIYYSRLSHYPWLPIGGIVWKASETVEVDLLFPNTTVTWNLTKKDTLTYFAELLGSGYQVKESDGSRLHLEYYQTQTGISWEHELAPGWSTTLQGGWATDRTMDFYGENRPVRLDAAPFLSVGFKARF